MKLIKESIIEEILARTDIAEVVSEYVELKKRGGGYEACCPFHHEKTPSFKVSPGRGTWHCFGACGEGGGVVSFVMKAEGCSFPDAIRKLAARLGIKVEEAEESDEDRERRQKREALMVATEWAADKFRSWLTQDKAAYDYATGRWGEEYVKECGVGFAPRGWGALADAAGKEGVSIDALMELGLLRKGEKGNVFDFFRGRVMIPIRDRYGRCIGFTGRDITGEKEAPKYMNSTESILYSKGREVFGLDVAWRAASREGVMYLVEGAPDVMRLHSIGEANAVAPLGTAWTAEQLKTVRRCCGRVCFLPDGDVPQGAMPYGAGVKAVMRSGRLAMEAGLDVTVAELPAAEDGGKTDPDSFITSRGRLKMLEEEDFIPWYAGKRMEAATGTAERGRVITEVAEMVAKVDSEVAAELLQVELNRVWKNKTLWANAICAARQKLGKDKDGRKKNGGEIDLYKEYKFYEEDGGYYSLTKEGEQYQLSNFTMRPLFHIKDTVNPKRLYEIKNQYGEQEMVEMKQDDMVSLQRFRLRLEGMGNFVWSGGETELIRLKRYLYRMTKTAKEMTYLGWHGEGYYVWGNGVWAEGVWWPVDEMGIVNPGGHGDLYLPAFSRLYKNEVQLFRLERGFSHYGCGQVSMCVVADQMQRVFGDNALVGLCYLLATLFKDVVTQETKSFPVLNAFGPKGGGKSEFCHTLMSFFIIDHVPANLFNSTVPAINDIVGAVSNALVHLDEYRNDIDVVKREFLKGLWDGTGRSRMNMDKDKKKEMTAVRCGVMVSGQEMSTADIALFSRLIFLTFNRSEFSTEEKRQFDLLTRMRRKGFSHLTLELLGLRETMEQGFAASYEYVMGELSERLNKEQVEDRILRNWAIPLAALHAAGKEVDFGFTFGDMLLVTVDGILRQNRECKRNNELSGFWNRVSYLLQEGQIFYHADLRVRVQGTLKTNQGEMEVQPGHPVLLLNKTRVFMQYRKTARQVGDTCLPESSLLYYLQNSPEFLGAGVVVRFANIVNGVEQSTKKEDGTFAKNGLVQRALAFDYNAIRDKYGVNFYEPGE